jgi:hypothetical protein
MEFNIDRSRGTGRSTAQYLAIISTAIRNPNRAILYQDHHFPHTYMAASCHADRLRTIIKSLNLLDITVTVSGKDVSVLNMYDPWPRTALEEAWKKEVGRYPNEADLKDRSAFYYFRKGFDSTFSNSAFIEE